MVRWGELTAFGREGKRLIEEAYGAAVEAGAPECGAYHATVCGESLDWCTPEGSAEVGGERVEYFPGIVHDTGCCVRVVRSEETTIDAERVVLYVWEGGEIEIAGYIGPDGTVCARAARFVSEGRLYPVFICVTRDPGEVLKCYDPLSECDTYRVDPSEEADTASLLDCRPPLCTPDTAEEVRDRLRRVVEAARLTPAACRELAAKARRYLVWFSAAP